MAQMTFLAHETLHMSSLDPSNGILCLVCAQDPPLDKSLKLDQVQLERLHDV